MRRTVNLKAIAILAATTASVVVAAHLVHGIQMKRNSGELLVRADRAEIDGKPSVAVECLTAFLNLQPDNKHVRARLGMLLSKHARTHRQRREACLLLERALQEDPTQIELRRALIRLWIDAGRFEEAKAQLESIRQSNPDDDDLPFLMAQCEEGLKNLELAAAYYAEACELQPDRVEIFVRRSELLRDKLRAMERADGVIRAMVEHNPRLSEAQLAAARYYTHSYRWDEADSRLQIALSLDPTPEPTVYLWAADVSIARGEDDSALVRLRTGLQNHPENISLRLMLARIELQLGHRREALARLQPLMESFPHQPDDVVRLCGLLIDLDQFEKAATAFDRLRGNVAPAIIGFLQAHFLVKEEAWGQARVLLAEAIPALGVSEWRLQANLLLGQCHERLGDSDAAWSAYNQAVQANRRNVTALLGRAAALVRMGRLDEAISGYRLAVQDNSEMNLPLVRLLILRNLQLPAMAREWSEADRLIDGLPKHLQSSPDAIVARAELLAAKGKHNEAASVLDAARQVNSDKLELWIASIERAASQGHVAEVTRLLEDARTRFPMAVELGLTRVRLATRQPLEVARRELEALESESQRFESPDQNRLLAAAGDAYAQLGDVAAAVNIWKHLATRAPKDLVVRVQLFAAASQADDESEVQRLLDEIRHLEGQGGSFSAYGEAALLAIRAQRGEKTLLAHATARADLAASQRPNWSAAALLQAQIAEMQGNVDVALERYQRAVELGERQPNVVRRLVDLLYRRQRYAEAQTVLRKLPAPAVLESGLGRHAVALTLLTTADNDSSRRRAYDLARQSVPSDSKESRDFLWLGQVAVAAGLNTEAEAMFRRAAELDPETPDPWMALITMLIQTDRARVADVISEAKGKLSPDKAGLALAPAFEMLGQPEEAQKHYEAVLALKPDDPETLGSVAGFHVRTGHWPKAEECLRRMLQLRPGTNEFGHPWARRHLAIVLAASGTYAKYREALALLSENQPATLDDELARGVVQATQPDQRDQAIALLEKVHQQRPLRSREMLVLARLHEAGGNREKALACVVQLVQLNPSDPNPLAYLIELLTKHGFQQSAREWLAKLEKMNADPFLVMSLRAKWLQKGGQGDEAVRVVTTFANQNTSSLSQAAALLEDIGRSADAEPLYRAFAERSKPVGVLLLARFLGRQHRVDEALALCELLWVSVPAEAVADTCLSVFRSTRATEVQFQRVETWLAAAIRSQPHSIPLIALRAELHFHARQYAESIAGYREVLARDPSHVVALNLLAWMLAVKDGQGPEALGLVKRAIDLIGPRPDLLDTRAMVYLSLGQTKEAIQDLREVVRLSPSASAYFHLALAYHKANDRAKTEEAFRKAQEIGISPLAVHPLERRAFNQLVAALSD